MNTRNALALALTVTLSLTACDNQDSVDTEDTAAAEREVEAHIEVIRDRIAASNAQDWDTWEALHTKDAERTAPDLLEPLVSAADMRSDIEELFVTFPDYNLELVEAFGQDNRLIARIHTRGTMLGPIDFNGVEVPPTGLSFEQDWVAVLTFDGDKISAIDEFYDNYGTLLQLGLAQ